MARRRERVVVVQTSPLTRVKCFSFSNWSTSRAVVLHVPTACLSSSWPLATSSASVEPSIRTRRDGTRRIIRAHPVVFYVFRMPPSGSEFVAAYKKGQRHPVLHVGVAVAVRRLAWIALQGYHALREPFVPKPSKAALGLGIELSRIRIYRDLDVVRGASPPARASERRRI